MTETNRTQQAGEAAASPQPPAFDRVKPRRGFAEADAYLRAAVKHGASDLHLKSGQAPCLRIEGKLRKLDAVARPTDEFEAGILAFLTEEERRRLLVEGSVDLAYELDGEARFRVNIHRQESGISLAARIVPRRIPSFDELHLPPVVATIADCRQGLVLVSTPIVRKLITENRDVELNEVIRSGDAGMLSFTQSLYRLFQQRLIDHETGRQAAPSIEEFEMSLRGIRQSQRGVLD